MVTWNLQGTDGLDVDAVADVLRAAKPDVLFAQEVTRRQAAGIGESLSARTVSWSFKHRSFPRRAEGMATIGLTVPMHVTGHAITFPIRFWSWRRRIVQRTEIEVDGAAIGVVHAHLSPHPAGRPRRLREADGLVRADPSTTIVVGDLNETPGGPTLQRLRTAGLHDAWSDAVTEGPGETNWSGSREEPADQRLDYVLYGLALHADRAAVPDTTGPDRGRWARLSDHLPLTVVVSLTG
jgi:endonuclease/exonuclease/phosphatase family metal-dependent hydrolase